MSDSIEVAVEKDEDPGELRLVMKAPSSVHGLDTGRGIDPTAGLLGRALDTFFTDQRRSARRDTLGRGVTGVVFRALDRELDVEIAIEVPVLGSTASRRRPSRASSARTPSTRG